MYLFVTLSRLIICQISIESAITQLWEWIMPIIMRMNDRFEFIHNRYLNSSVESQSSKCVQVSELAGPRTMTTVKCGLAGFTGFFEVFWEHYGNFSSIPVSTRSFPYPPSKQTNCSEKIEVHVYDSKFKLTSNKKEAVWATAQLFLTKI